MSEEMIIKADIPEGGLLFDTSKSPWSFAVNPSRSVVTIVEGLDIEVKREMPNVWWRFWQWVFFGFRWKAIVKPDTVGGA